MAKCFWKVTKISWKNLVANCGNQKFSITNYGNQKLAIEKISSCNSMTRKLNIWSPILWQSNLFLVTIHNGGNSSVMNFFLCQSPNILACWTLWLQSLILWFVFCIWVCALKLCKGGWKLKPRDEVNRHQIIKLAQACKATNQMHYAIELNYLCSFGLFFFSVVCIL